MARRNRRSGQGSRLGLIVAVLLVVALVALVINGIVSAATSSSGYLSVVNRSFATQANAVIADQNETGDVLGHLLVVAPTLERQMLQLRLDQLVSATSGDAEVANRAASPPPSADVGPRFAKIISDRAQAVALIRTAIDGLLGMAPLPVPGASSSSGATASGASSSSALLSASEATSDLTKAGQMISSANALMGPVRQDLRAAPGRAWMNRSHFVRDSSLLSSDAMASLVSDLEASSSLAVVHHLVLSAVVLRPTPLPTPGSTVTNLPPTRSLSVVAVIQNLGNVTESPVRVTATISTTTGTLLHSSTTSGTVGPSGAVTLDPSALVVAPGTTVILTVSVTPPPGQTDHSGLVQTQTLFIAPSTANLTPTS